MPTDVARFFQTSAEGGHAGPGSTWDYIHLIEEPLAYWLQKARPGSWVSVGPHEFDAVLFPDIGEGVLLDARTAPPPRTKPAIDAKARGTGELALARRIEIAQRLIARKTVEEIAGHCSMEAGNVLGCIRAIVLALVDAGLANDEALNTPSRQIDDIWLRISDQRDRPFRHRDRPFRERDRPFR